MFKQIDKNGDGYITKKEFKEFSENFQLGLDIDKMFEDIDLDMNGAINYSEFIAAIMNEKAAKNPDRIKAAFKFFDQNNDGVISKEDFIKVLQSDGTEHVNDALIDEILCE